ncbi:uncharacterized protein DDB_G0284459-like, partial [Copidosoma floridanum]|uniref:uncharacterized protein DDB_G0284459-like n=1 Tax=Copidosoma floridanum TaxID=29053 RepID=UPI0006C98EC3
NSSGVHHGGGGGVWFLPHGGTTPAEGFTYIDGETAHKLRRSPLGALPGGSASLRLCTSPNCTNGDLANGSAVQHTYSDLNFTSLRRNGGRAVSTARSPKSSPSPPPPPPPRYPAQYPTLPMNNGSVCHHNRQQQQQSKEQQHREPGSAGTLSSSAREQRRDKHRESGRRMEQLSASSHQQRQEELEVVHRGSLARRDMAGYHA